LGDLWEEGQWVEFKTAKVVPMRSTLEIKNRIKMPRYCGNMQAIAFL
jgi:hypothetical protein